MICLVSRENAHFQPERTKHNYVNGVKKFLDSDSAEEKKSETVTHFAFFLNHFVISKQKQQNGLCVPNWKSIFRFGNLHAANFHAHKCRPNGFASIFNMHVLEPSGGIFTDGKIESFS